MEINGLRLLDTGPVYSKPIPFHEMQTYGDSSRSSELYQSFSIKTDMGSRILENSLWNPARYFRQAEFFDHLFCILGRYRC